MSYDHPKAEVPRLRYTPLGMTGSAKFSDTHHRMISVRSMVLSIVLALSLDARADLVVKQRVEGAGMSGEQTVRVKDNKARCDVAGAISVIVDRTTGETTTLSHAQRGYVTLDAARSKALNEKLQKARGSSEAPKLVATGKKEKIGDQSCDVFSADVGTVKLTYWLAKSYPNFAAINAQLDVLENAPDANLGGGLAPRTKDLPGLPMKIQMETGGQKVIVTTLSVTEEKVDPGIFTAPKDYKELPSTPPPPQP